MGYNGPSCDHFQNRLRDGDRPHKLYLSYLLEFAYFGLCVCVCFLLMLRCILGLFGGLVG